MAVFSLLSNKLYLELLFYKSQQIIALLILIPFGLFWNKTTCFRDFITTNSAQNVNKKPAYVMLDIKNDVRIKVAV